MIKNYIDDVCKMLPEPMSELIKDVADMYLMKEFEIINSHTPEQLCAHLALCEDGKSED
jgi:hypothetical protein